MAQSTQVERLQRIDNNNNYHMNIWMIQVPAKSNVQFQDVKNHLKIMDFSRP